MLRLSARFRVALVAALLGGCGPSGDSFVSPTSNGPSTPATLTVLSGNNQTMTAGLFATSPFAVQVTDSHGIAVHDVVINWRVASGAGSFAQYPNLDPLTSQTSITNDKGIAFAILKPSAAGLNRVEATSTALTGWTASFSSTVSPADPATVPLPAVISFSPIFDCVGTSDPAQFRPKEGTVVVGDSVRWEFLNSLAPECMARLKSVTVPPGGDSFESASLAPGQRFKFVPKVAGTWEYIDVVSGGRGKFTAINP